VQPTLQLKGTVPVNDDAGLEREADLMGAKANSLVSTEGLSEGALLVSNSVQPVVQGQWNVPFDEMNEVDRARKQELLALTGQSRYSQAFYKIMEWSGNSSMQVAYMSIIKKAKQDGKMAELAQDLMISYHNDQINFIGAILEGLEQKYGRWEKQSPFDAEPQLSPEEIAGLDEQFVAEQFSPQERGMLAVEEIQALAASVKSQDELTAKFPYLASKYGMVKIGYVPNSNPIRLGFKINPEFEIQLSGGHAVEMRSEGTGGSVQTRVLWTPNKLNLSTSTHTGGGSYTVGNNMRAYPLSQDHATGSKAAADSDHVGMMTKLPSKNNRSKTGSGSGPYFYIRGHLLNDNLGGIANEANLFPITHEANGQHKTYVEQYIKNGIKDGYVYRYEVQVSNISVGYDTGLSLYTVDSDLQFSFARLDTALKDVPGTVHTGKIESRYKSVGAEPFDKSTEYTTDYNGSYNHPKKVGTEAVSKSKENSVVGSNAGLTGNVSAFTITAPTGSSAFGASTTTTITQGVNPSGTLVATNQKLSLRQSNPTNVVDYFDDITTGWAKSDITNWVGAVKSKSLSKWDDVWNEATTHHKLLNTVPPLIQSSSFLTRVSINGAAVGT